MIKTDIQMTYHNMIVVAIAVVLSYLLMNLAPTFVGVPFFWLAFLWFWIFLGNIFLYAHPRIKVILFNLAFLTCVCGLFEVYYWKRWNHEQQSLQDSAFEIYSRSEIPPSGNAIRADASAFVTRDDLLGYAPYKNNRVFCFLYDAHKTLLLSGVSHTIDADGLRIAPPYNSNNRKGSILFLGCSFTFGAYLNDHETLPYQVGEQLHGTYHIYNFGLNGYGPHQMLSAIEHGRIQQIVKDAPRYIIYQAIIDHAYRVNGLRNWTRYDPKYVLNDASQPILSGQMGEPSPSSHQQKSDLAQKLQWYLDKIYIYKLLSNRPIRLTDGNINLFVAIVKKSQRLLKQAYPEASFHIILWDEDPGKSPQKEIDAIVYQFRQEGFQLHFISDILPESAENLSQYIAFGHPNAMANKRIAEYVVTHIVNENSEK